MIDREQFLGLVRQEAHVLKYLGARVDASKLAFRLGDNQRTTAELLEYLTLAGWLPTHALVEGSWNDLAALREAAPTVTLDNFAELLDVQVGKMEEMVRAIPDEDFSSRKVTMPWGDERPLGEALIALPYTFLASYRLQLFTHLKSAGQTTMGTREAWLGQPTS